MRILCDAQGVPEVGTQKTEATGVDPTLSRHHLTRNQ